MKKILSGFCLILFATIVHAQNGLENIVVEKYYISNAADSVGSIGVLPVGSVTYRIYADMLPGYKFQAAYGVSGHTLLFTTSTSFFNNEDRGATTPTYTKTQARGNSIMLDSWLSVGAGCTANFGILKSEDNVATGGATVINNTVPPILQNNDPLAGIPLTTQDGLYTGTPEPVTFVGITASDLSVLDALSNVGNSFSTSNGSWASLNGSVGPIAATNKVLIAQITTNGVFHFELNIQIGTPTGGVQNFVAQNPVGAEISLASLTGNYGASNISPTVSITSPANNASFITGAVVPINATAADADGTVSSVEFFVDAVSIGIDNSSPYSMNYTSTTGTHLLTAKATDNNSAQTTSSAITINVTSNPPPVVNITAPANGSVFTTGAVVAITATATDNVSVASVEFFVDGVSIGLDNSSPYGVNYNSTAGSHVLTALATDNQSAQTTSSPVNITVGNNIPPSINITAPSGGALYTAPAIVNITADATDADGSITLVEFYVNGVLAGSDATFPYSYNWNSVIGSANITARATDDQGAHTTSSGVLISIADPNIPYKIITSKNICLPSSFCLPLNAIDTVNNVIGYDLVLNYNKIKVHPTGVITVGNALINPSYVDVISNIDSINGVMNISLFFNSSAPANTKFSGLGNLLCVEFTKTAGFTSIDSASFSIPTLQESYFPGVSIKNVDPGKYITFKDTAFHGILKFWLNNSPLGYNDINPNQYLVTNIFGNNSACTNKSVVAVQPDTTGQFDYSISNGQDITIERDILASTSVQPVINGFDALLARKMIIKDPTFVPSVYQAIALDVNLDGVVSAGDVSQINQRAVLMIPEFKQAWNYNAQGVSNGQLSKDWLYIDSTTITTNAAYHISSTFPLNDGIGYSKDRIPVVPFCLPVPVTNLATCPVISSESYKGILIGDINGNYSTVGSGGLFKQSGNEAIVFDLSNTEISNGYVDIPVSVSSLHNVNALDIALKYNEDNLKFESVIDHTNYLSLLTNFNPDDRTLRLTSNSFMDYELNKSILSVRFKIISNVFNADDLYSLEGYLNGDRVALKLRKDPITSANNNSVRIYPNPASDVINIEVSDDATIQLLDLQGRQVILEKNVNANRVYNLNTSNLGNGVYMMKIFNNNFFKVDRIVISK